MSDLDRMRAYVRGELDAAAAAEFEARLAKDAALADVMDLISREQRANVFVSTDSVETVSFSLYDMTVPEAIRAIANAAGMAVATPRTP